MSFYGLFGLLFFFLAIWIFVFGNEIRDVFVDGYVGVLLLAIELEDGKLRDFIVKKFHNEPFNILLIAID